MAFMNVTATINIDVLDKVETRLREIGVPGISVSKVKGYGLYKDFFQRDMMTTHARIQIYAPEDRIKSIVDALIDSAHTGRESDGVVLVSPIQQMHRISSKKEILPEDFR